MVHIEKTRHNLYGDDSIVSASDKQRKILLRRALLRKVPSGYNANRKTVGKRGTRKSRAYWRGKFYYRHESRNWRDSENGKIYINVRYNPLTREYEGTGQI